MPALNFKMQFADKVEKGEKIQTIRATRKRPFRCGDKLYLYTGLRTKYCKKIGESVCHNVEDVEILSNGVMKLSGQILNRAHKCVDLVLTDPPYGNNDAIDVKNSINHKANRTEYKQFSNIMPEQIYFNEMRRVSKNQIIWGANYFGLCGGFLCWNKEGTVFGEAELAYCSMFNAVRIYKYTWNGMIQENMKEKEKRFHPTQKPVALFQWLLQNYSQSGMTIFDPFAGSGTTAIACLETGRNYILVEKEPDYVKIINKRIETWKEQGRLFTAHVV